MLPSALRCAISSGVLAVLALAAGCSAGPRMTDMPDSGPVAGYPDHSADQIRALVAASVAPVRSYRSEARIEAASGERDLRVSAGLRARLADTLFAVVRGPFGIEGGRALVTPDSFFAHDKLNGRLYVGGVGAAEQYVPGAGTPGALARALLGLDVPEVGPGWTVRPDSGRYVLSGPGEAWTIDPRTWRALRVEARAADGRPLSRRDSGFVRVGGVVVPRHVVLASPSDGARLTVEHRDVTLNPPELAFPFDPPLDLDVREVSAGG